MMQNPNIRKQRKQKNVTYKQRQPPTKVPISPAPTIATFILAYKQLNFEISF